jgi:gluconokinase
MDCIITIELGANAVRIIAFQLNGQIIESMKGSYVTYHTQPDYSEQDPEQIFITMLFVLKKMLAEKIHPKKIKVLSICFSAAMHSVLAVDKKGLPLGNAITWADNRGKKIAQELKQSPMGNALYHATGTPIHPMSPMVKIAWLKNNDKERFKSAEKFLSIKTYIIQQLTGEYFIDYSLASATGLLNIHSIKWEADALAFAGISADKLPQLIPIFNSPGKLRKEYQNSLGLNADTKLIIGSSDGCSATLGAGIWGQGNATVTIGDSGAVRIIGNEVLKDNKHRFFNYLLAENYYVSGGPTNNGGIIFEWFAKQFGDFTSAYNIEDCIEGLIGEASKVKAGADGLLFLPYLLGERAPIWNANARGLFFGLNINHEKKHFIRACLEGIMYEILSIGKALEEGRKIDSLSVNGSFASIPFCSQLLADMFNKPVKINNQVNSGGLGTFFIGAMELGLYKSFEEVTQTVLLPQTFLPQANNHIIYSNYFGLFERLSTKLNEEFEVIANLQEQHK